MQGWIRTMLAAAVGGGVTAATLLGAGAVDSGRGRGVDPARSVEGAFVRLANGSGALTAREIYRRRAPGVAYIQAQSVRADRTPFDVEDGSQPTGAGGSGFLLDDEGLILTSAHVVAAATDIQVKFSEDETFAARPVGTDPDTDLALLRIDADGVDDVEPLELGDSDSVEVGDPAVAIGNPFGGQRTLSTGVVSALERRLTAPSGFALDDVIQTDAAVDPGNAGGPLLDASGRVIGVNSQLAVRRGAGVGIGFAVPVNTAKEVIPQLEETGRVERAYLGVHGAPADGGVRIERLQPGSPAAAAGIREADVLRRLGGREVRSMEDVSDVLAARAPGAVVDVEVLSGDERRALKARLALRPAALPAE